MTSLDEFMAAIRQVESGGRYSIGKNGSGASGAYQFIDSTWGGYGGYSSAYLAPPEVQDAKARQLMQAYYDQFGDWDHVAAAWIGGPGTAAKGPSAWGSISDSNMTVAAYVNRVNQAMGNPTGNPTVDVANHQQSAASLGNQIVAQSSQTLGSKLTGVLGAIGSPQQQPGSQYTQTSAHGDSLGERLKAIMGVIDGGGPASV